MRRLRTRFVLAAAVAGATIAMAPPASADSYTCDSGEYCTWNAINFDSPAGIFTTAGRLTDYAGWNFYFSGSQLDNRVSSWRNNGINSGPTVIYSYHEKNGAGGQLWRGGLGNSDSWVGAGANDYASSHYWFYS